MKNSLLSILIVFFISNYSYSQVVNIPDNNFLQQLIYSGVDTDNDGQIQLSEAEAVSILNMPSSNISNLKGIEAFANLNTLYCDYNFLTSLDLTGLTNLETIYCGNNSISNLNVTSNINLRALHCEYNQLTNIDLHNNIKLDGLICNNNPISSLNLENNPRLAALNCSSTNISTLDLRNIDLDIVLCTSNPSLSTICINPSQFMINFIKDETTEVLDNCAPLNVNILESSIFSIFPNPTKGILNIKFENTEKEIQITVFDILGDKIISKSNFDNKNELKMDLSHVSKGIYFVKVQNKNEFEIQKIVIE